jgi:hypothetical protein
MLRRRTRLIDLLPRTLWRRGTTLFGGRLHFCLVVDSDGRQLRSVEWKAVDKLVGRRAYRGAHHERDPGPWDDPDSYYDD